MLPITRAASAALQASKRGSHWQKLLHDQAAPLTRLVLLEGLSCDLNLMQQLQQQLEGWPAKPGTMAGNQTVELAGLCEQVARHYRSGSVQLSVPRLTIQLDVQQLKRVLHNLIDNALEHGSPPVHIRAYPVPEGLVLEVEDRGPALEAVAADLAGGWCGCDWVTTAWCTSPASL